MIKQLTILLMGFPLIAGCINNQAAPRIMSPPSGYYSVGDPALTSSDARAIAVANDFLEKNSGKSVNAYYHPRKVETGYYVDVIYVAINDKGENSYADFSSSVRISADWQNVGYIRW